MCITRPKNNDIQTDRPQLLLIFGPKTSRLAVVFDFFNLLQNKMRYEILSKIIFVLLLSQSVYSQIDDDKMGAWYMYFNTTFNDGPWGVQGDVQCNWNLGGDLEQLLLRGGLTYQGKIQ